jgi:hypothetical protein
MNDITFKSIVFNDEDNDKHYASAEAKMAEKKIKEILKKARELKKKRLIEKRNQNGIPKNIGSPNKKLLDTSVIVVNSPVL